MFIEPPVSFLWGSEVRALLMEMLPVLVDVVSNTQVDGQPALLTDVHRWSRKSFGHQLVPERADTEGGAAEVL